MVELTLPEFERTNEWISLFLKEGTTQKVFEIISRLDGYSPKGTFELNVSMPGIHALKEKHPNFKKFIEKNCENDTTHSDDAQSLNINPQSIPDHIQDHVVTQDSASTSVDIHNISNTDLPRFVYILKRRKKNIPQSNDTHTLFARSKPASSKKLAKKDAARTLFMKILNSSEREALLDTVESYYQKITQVQPSLRETSDPISLFVTECAKRFITIDIWRYPMDQSSHPFLFGATTVIRTPQQEEFILSAPIQYTNHSEAKKAACIQGLKLLTDINLEQQDENLATCLSMAPKLIQDNNLQENGILVQLYFFQLCVDGFAESIGIITRLPLLKFSTIISEIELQLLPLHRISLTSENLRAIKTWYYKLEQYYRISEERDPYYCPFVAVPIKDESIDWEEIYSPHCESISQSKYLNLQFPTKEEGTKVCRIIHLLHVAVITNILRKTLLKMLHPLLSDDMYLKTLTETSQLNIQQVIGEEGVRFLCSICIFLSFPTCKKGQLSMKRVTLLSNKLLFERISDKNLQLFRQTELMNPTQSIFAPFTSRPMGFRKVTNIVYIIAGAILFGNTYNDRLKKLYLFLDKWEIISMPSWEEQLAAAKSNYTNQSSNTEINSTSEFQSFKIAIFEHMHYKFQHENILYEAIYNSGRLGFLGDAILGYTCEMLLLEEFPELSATEVAQLKQLAVSNTMFSEMLNILLDFPIEDREITLKNANFLPSSDLQEKPLRLSSVKSKADLWEAVCGAMFLDMLLCLQEIDDAVNNFTSLIFPIWKPHLQCLSSKRR